MLGGSPARWPRAKLQESAPARCPLASVERFVLGQGLIGGREIARALTDAAAVFVPVAYKPLFLAGKAGGRDRGLRGRARRAADPSAAPGRGQQSTGPAGPAYSNRPSTRINADLDALVDASEAAIRDFLNAELRSALLSVSRSVTTAADHARPGPQIRVPVDRCSAAGRARRLPWPRRRWEDVGAQVVLGLGEAGNEAVRRPGSGELQEGRASSSGNR